MEDVPPELRGLQPETAALLSPLQVDVGPEVRASQNPGYRQHAALIRFRWQTKPVKERLKTIDNQEERQRAKIAYKFLRKCPTSAYKEFDEEHKKFLAEQPDADVLTRRRRLQFLERPGLECALWPCLFWDKAKTFSGERATAAARVARRDAEPLEAVLFPPVEDEDEDAERLEGEETDFARHSVKRVWSVLALGRLLGPLGFQNDLAAWVLGSSHENPVRL
ncbi:MAG: hypothetical protein NXI12_15365 [Alphaproteobacteria bacterium]|nr:hypothetical protein [Alphaproteobacteria bacterium]